MRKYLSIFLLCIAAKGAELQTVMFDSANSQTTVPADFWTANSAVYSNILSAWFLRTNIFDGNTNKYLNGAGLLSIPPGGGAGGLGTNFFLNGILLQPARITNSASLTWGTNANGDVVATVVGGGSSTNGILDAPSNSVPYVRLNSAWAVNSSTNILDVTTIGRAILQGASAAGVRTTLGLGTAALSATGDFAAASHTHTATDISDSTSIGRTVLTGASASAIRASLVLVPGTDIQAFSSRLLQLATVSPATGAILYYDGANWTNLAIGSTGQSLLVTNGIPKWMTFAGGAAGGDVNGPGSATDGALVLFDGTTGKLIKNSGLLTSGGTNLTVTGELIAFSLTLSNLIAIQFVSTKTTFINPPTNTWATASRLLTTDSAKVSANTITTADFLFSISDTNTLKGELTRRQIMSFTPALNQASVSATQTNATLSSRNNIQVLEFDFATPWDAVFSGIIPDGAVLTSGLTVTIHWMTSATSGNARWGASFWNLNTDLDSDSYDTEVLATTACNGTSGIQSTTTITVTTIDSLAIGNNFRLKIRRHSEDALDTIDAANTQLIDVSLKTAN